MSKKNKRDKGPSQEAEMAPAVAPAQVAVEKETIDFDGWWARRATKIPTHHHKEVIKADFRGRGLSMKESMDDYDAALKKYGIKLS